MTYSAAYERPSIRRAIRRWEAAFAAIGTRDHGYSDRMIWVESMGFWLKVEGWKRANGFRYWNGLGNQLGDDRRRNLIVEINPPDGPLPSRWQGLVASDEAGAEWMLHAGELNAGSKRIHLRDFADRHSIERVDVSFPDGNVRPYYKVACLEAEPAKVVTQTKSFLDACIKLRSLVSDDSETSFEVQKRAALIEEALGSIHLKAKDAKVVDRLHADVWHALKDALISKGELVANQRVAAHGPDLYTLSETDPALFEIKTKAGASDYMKAIGQLIVYDRLLGGKYRKMMVVPKQLPKSINDILDSLDVRVVTYIRDGKDFTFSGI